MRQKGLKYIIFEPTKESEGSHIFNIDGRSYKAISLHGFQEQAKEFQSCGSVNQMIAIIEFADPGKLTNQDPHQFMGWL